MKKLLAIFTATLALCAMVSFVQGQLISLGQTSYGYVTVVTNVAPAAGLQLLLTNSAEITTISVQSDGTNANVVEFLDDKYGNGVWTNQAYASRLSYLTNVTLKYTNYDVIVTNTYTGVLWTVTNLVASNMNVCLPVVSVSVPVGGVASVGGKFDFSKGVTVRLTTNATITYVYRRLF